LAYISQIAYDWQQSPEGLIPKLKLKSMNPKTSKIKLIFFLSILYAILLLPKISQAAATYYVATNGSDINPGTNAQPWATFSKAMTILQPGDTLLIKDGTYYQSLDVTISGTAGNPITIKAENDGQAIVDGQSVRIPLQIYFPTCTF